MGFITDYLEKRGLRQTLQALYKENPEILQKPQVNQLIESVNEIRGSQTAEKSESVLFEWWKVFWNILKEKKKAPSSVSNSVPTSVSNRVSNSIDNAQIPQTQAKKLKRKPSTDSPNVSIAKDESINLNTDNKLTESWRMYLNLCKEYERSGVIVNAVGNTSGINTSGNSVNSTANSTNNILSSIHTNHIAHITNSTTTTASTNNNNHTSQYMGVIDQVNQPIDSRQLLLLRQSLYQEYIKKQQQQQSSIPVYSDTAKYAPENNDNNIIYSTPPMTDSFFDSQDTDNNEQEGRDELNFNDFMNEYLI